MQHGEFWSVPCAVETERELKRCLQAIEKSFIIDWKITKWIEKASFSNLKRRKKCWKRIISHGTILWTNEKVMWEGWGYKNLRRSLTETLKNSFCLEAEHPSNCMTEWSGVTFLHKASLWIKDHPHARIPLTDMWHGRTSKDLFEIGDLVNW